MPRVIGANRDHKRKVNADRAIKERIINKVKSEQVKSRDYEREKNKQYRHAAIKKFVYDSTVHYAKKIENEGVADIYEVIRCLKFKPVRANIIKRSKNTIKIMDTVLEGEKRINPDNADLTKQIDFFYRQCLIEMMVRFEIKRLKDLRWSNGDIIEILKNGKDSLGKGIIMDIENALAGLYDAGVKNLKIKMEIQRVIEDRISRLESINHVSSSKKYGIEDIMEK